MVSRLMVGGVIGYVFHLLFADDTILFSDAHAEQILSIYGCCYYVFKQ